MLVPLEEHQTLEEDLVTLQDTLLEATVKSPALVPDKIFDAFLPDPPGPSLLGVDQIYMINLGNYKCNVS